MRFVAAAALKDLRRRLADPVALVIWIGIPLAIGGLMNLVIGGMGGAPPRARVLVADQDGTVLSRLLAGGTGTSGLGDVIDFEPVPLEEGRRRIEAGNATALLVIPAGFQAAILEETPAELLLITNPAQRILPGIVEETLGIVIEGIFYAQRIFGAEVRQVSAGGRTPGDAEVAAASVAIAGRMRQLEGILLPPVIDLEVRVDDVAGAALNFGQLFFPGILFMSILFIAQGMSLDIWQERARGTLRRVLTTPQTAGALLAGKLAAGAVIVGLVVFVALLVSTWLFGVAWTRVPLALLWCVLAGAALLALMTLLHVSASSERGANLLSTLVIFPLIMIGGSFFPFEAMPAWMAAIGRWTPNGLALVRLKEILFGEPAAGALVLAAAALGVAGALAFALTVRRLRGSFATGA